MQRFQQKFPISNCKEFKEKLLYWAQQYDTVTWLDSNNHKEKYAQHEAILAVGSEKILSCNYNNAFEKLKEFQSNINDYIFGYLGYDLKNDIETISSNNFDGLHFPDLFFFQPKKIVFVSDTDVTFSYLNSEKNNIKEDFENIKNSSSVSYSKLEKPTIKLRIHKDAYLEKVHQVLQHIKRGDIYEANFCQEFYVENCEISPFRTYQKLNTISQPPFATFLKTGEHYLLSASPERYLQKQGTKVISQPIKGTAKRSANKEEDILLKKLLEYDTKEQAENVMIVDLVRNDLSKLAIKGSVKVEELCKVYSFKQVHQMISTIHSEVTEKMHPVDIIKNTYPMGSMTGAPKVAAMNIIENLEETKRGLYSGSVGYFSPTGDFDFNVIIRSILYNHKNRYTSYSVGSAITSLSVPEKELEECLLKAKAMKEVLLNNY